MYSESYYIFRKVYIQKVSVLTSNVYELLHSWRLLQLHDFKSPHLLPLKSEPNTSSVNT